MAENKDSKVVAFPHPEGGEELRDLTPEEKAFMEKIDSTMAEQDKMISEMINRSCRTFDTMALELNKAIPVHVPMESGLAIAATYLNMVSDQQGAPIESLMDDVQRLSTVINAAADEFYNNNPEVPANVYYYALIHSASASLRQQRMMNNVETLENEMFPVDSQQQDEEQGEN